ncbi:hypothetical protein SAMN05421847_2951 [Halpernia humi]|uniref:Uncharacterized protein n=1 Tax=Halpernia humi TaxID=493375 RepID=A0A1H6BL39_9FLAO|nr:hypothetical protein [Halpernia humi]SEG61097.1 hypothetical protein SAMN05421847_2951 [Halpernia humi]
MKNKFRGKMILLVLFVIAMFFAVSAIVMGLWNNILPDILGVKAISFWQAMGILVLSKILFGGFHGKGGFGRNKFRRIKEERMRGMTDEQKEKLKEVWKQRCERGFFRDKF